MSRQSNGKALCVAANEGRAYDMGRITAIFKADGQETGGQCSVSEWWLEPNTKGVGVHTHPTGNEIFYVIEGTISFLVGEAWRNVDKGSLVFVPPGIPHDFENRSQQKAGLLNGFAPGAFEESMPRIVDWFANHPPEDAIPSHG